MSVTLKNVQHLIQAGRVKVSDHGYDELAADGLLVSEILASAGAAEVLEDYPEFPKGPCVLVLQYDSAGLPVHVVWGFPAGKVEPAVLITAYRPEPRKWSDDFRKRRT